MFYLSIQYTGALLTSMGSIRVCPGNTFHTAGANNFQFNHEYQQGECQAEEYKLIDLSQATSLSPFKDMNIIHISEQVGSTFHTSYPSLWNKPNMGLILYN